MWNPPQNPGVVSQLQRSEWFEVPFDVFEPIPELVKWRESKNRKLLDDTWAVHNAKVFLNDYTGLCMDMSKPNGEARPFLFKALQVRPRRLKKKLSRQDWLTA